MGDNMENFMNDFTIFFNKIFECIKNLWNWFSSSIIGEIFFFIIIISLFLFILNLIIDFKD